MFISASTVKFNGLQFLLVEKEAQLLHSFQNAKYLLALDKNE